MRVFLSLLALACWAQAQQCPLTIGTTLNKCLKPLQSVVRKIATSEPEVNTLALPLFNINKTHIMEICDVYPAAKECVSKDNFESCPEYLVWKIVDSLFGVPCSKNKDSFLREYQCINAKVTAKKECLDVMKTPQTATKDWDKCSKAPGFYKCISGDIRKDCGENATAVFEETLMTAGCKDFKKQTTDTEIRRRPVSQATNQKTAANPDGCNITKPCQDVVNRLESESQKSNASHPLFLLSREDFEEICPNSADLEACATCKNNPVSKITQTVSLLCKDPAKLAKSFGCTDAIKERRAECLEKIRYDKKCEGKDEFTACVRVIAMTKPACRIGSAVITEFMNQC